MDTLVRFVAQASSEREELRVVSAEVEVPAEILRLGFTFVDTPGIGSAIEANTATTESFLPRADAVIFVTSFDAPLSEAELEFLATVRTHVEKLFIVVNKRDLVGEAEVDSILGFVRERLGPDGARAAGRLFATSAWHALAARTAGDRAGVAASGVPELERPLVHFLAGERSRIFLRQTSGRAERLLARQRLDLELGRLAHDEDAERREGRQASFEQRINDLIGEVRDVAAKLRGRLATDFPAALHEASRSWPEQLTQLAPAGQEQDWPEPRAWTARGRLEQARMALEDAVAGAVEGWTRERVAEVQALLRQLAAVDLDALQRLPQSVERVAADAFGIAAQAAAPGRAGWSPSELPRFAPRPVPFTIPVDLPWWSSVVPAAWLQSGGRRRLSDGLHRGIVAYCTDLRHAFAGAGEHWLETLSADAQARTRNAAARLRERLRLPGSDRHLELLTHIDHRLAAFRETLAAWDPGPVIADGPDLDERTTPEQVRDLMAACVICQRIARVPFDYLAHAQYRLATRTDSRRQHAEQGGFCALHTWQYAQIASDVGVARGYAELTGSTARVLRAAVHSASTASALRDAVHRLVPGGEGCPVCRAVAEAQQAAIAELIATPPPGSEATVQSLCLPHLAATLAADPGLEPGRSLAGNLAEALERAAEDMQTYALKRESLRRHLTNDEERAAHLRTVARIAGHRELARPWRTDDELPFS